MCNAPNDSQSAVIRVNPNLSPKPLDHAIRFVGSFLENLIRIGPSTSFLIWAQCRCDSDGCRFVELPIYLVEVIFTVVFDALRDIETIYSINERSTEFFQRIMPTVLFLDEFLADSKLQVFL
jgi:hypothetical protein